MNYSRMSYYILLPYVLYCIFFKRTVNVFAGRVRIVSHSSCRTSAILKYFCPLTGIFVFGLRATLTRPSQGFLGNRVIISGEQGDKDQILRGTGEQRQYWGTGNIRKQIFDFRGTGEQANLFQGYKGTGTPPEGLTYLIIFQSRKTHRNQDNDESHGNHHNCDDNFRCNRNAFPHAYW